MQRENKETISIDVCNDHGVWLDSGELEKIIAKVSQRFARYSERAVREATRSGKMSGAMWGWMSLWLD